MPGSSGYDYILVINPNIDLFTIRSYIYDDDNGNISTPIPSVNLTFLNWNDIFNNQSIVTMEVGDSDILFNTLNPTIPEKLGDKLVTILGHKLFGHGNARAAIYNDTEFYTHDAKIWDHLSTNISNNLTLIFDRYKEIRNISPSSESRNFDFNNINFEFQLNFSGTINSLFVKNGRDVGGTKIINSNYNIPILVKFYTSNN
jgi:hypothetical protein